MSVKFNGERLRQLRMRRGLTPEELAVAAGRSIGAVRRFEIGQSVPNVEVAARMAGALGVDVAELVAEK